ncbi:MAG: sialidase family protein [Rhizobiaceae bacterium]
MPETVEAKHRIVYRDENAFGSHPFLGGLWRVANGDLVCAFMRADCTYESGSVNHDRITMSRRQMCTIRSRDGGRSWDAASLQPIFETPEPAGEQVGPTSDESGDFDLSSADSIVAMGSSPALLIPEATPWMRLSTDGGVNWRRPIRIPTAQFASLSGHGGFARRQDGLWIAGLTAASADGRRRRPVLYGSCDGRDWAFLSFITPAAFDDEVDAPPLVTPRFGAHRYMYPRPLPLRDGRLICSVRSQRDPVGTLWTEIFESEDMGRTFRFLSRVNDWGAPGDLVEMADGRLVCVYGYRRAPYGIRYRISEDGGRRWGREGILRQDGGSWDLGYPRVMEIEPGRLLAVYYMNLAGEAQAGGGVRHVASSEFSPG